MYRFYLFIAVALLCGCSQRTYLAPIEDGVQRNRHSTLNTYQVRYGETLFSIARKYHLDCRQIINNNHLKPPYALQAGQTLDLNTVSWVRPAIRPVHNKTREAIKPPREHENSQWRWPLSGRVVEVFSPRHGRQGITVKGRQHERIVASAAGVVVYSGAGLSGPGKMIIIRHANSILTAYDNTSRNLVAEGRHVRAGQAIAEAGIMDGRFFGVHFEIRKAGKPLNPMLYLSKR